MALDPYVNSTYDGIVQLHDFFLVFKENWIHWHVTVDALAKKKKMLRQHCRQA